MNFWPPWNYEVLLESWQPKHLFLILPGSSHKLSHPSLFCFFFGSCVFSNTPSSNSQILASVWSVLPLVSSVAFLISYHMLLSVQDHVWFLINCFHLFVGCLFGGCPPPNHWASLNRCFKFSASAPIQGLPGQLLTLWMLDTVLSSESSGCLSAWDTTRALKEPYFVLCHGWNMKRCSQARVSGP